MCKVETIRNVGFAAHRAAAGGYVLSGLLGVGFSQRDAGDGSVQP